MSAEQPRDWDRELAEIDKLIAAGPAPQPAARPAAAGAAPAARPQSAPPARASRRAALRIWLRVGLAAVLGVGMTQWPYAHACGLPLMLYLGAVGVVVVAGLWGSVSAWRGRLGAAHSVGLLVALWGGVLAAAVVLPRVGYARVAATWWCP